MLQIFSSARHTKLQYLATFRDCDQGERFARGTALYYLFCLRHL